MKICSSSKGIGGGGPTKGFRSCCVEHAAHSTILVEGGTNEGIVKNSDGAELLDRLKEASEFWIPFGEEGESLPAEGFLFSLSIEGEMEAEVLRKEAALLARALPPWLGGTGLWTHDALRKDGLEPTSEVVSSNLKI